MRAALMLLLVAMILQAADERGMKPLTVTDERGGTVTFTSSRALIIGNSAYTTGDWDELKGVREDVTAVQAALEQQGFAVQVEQNLTKTRMNEVMDAFIAEKAQDPAGRVVIYYAGHGQTVGTVGYLVPVDAPKPSSLQFKAKAYPISNLKIKAQESLARHVLFACDSCFSGSVFTPMRGANEYVLSAAREPVRMFLTAGSADETVPDVSFFRQEFVRGLSGAADLNRDGYVTGSELATYLKQTVRDRAGAMGKKLTPQTGVSEQEGFNRGDIVFAVPNGGASAAAPQPPPAAIGTGDLQARIEAERRAVVVRRSWDDWQGKMSAAFDAAQQQAADQQLSAALRTDIWQRFLRDWATDNPFSNEDERLRTAAQAGVATLSAAKPPAGTTIAPVEPTGQTATVGKPLWSTEMGQDISGIWAKLVVGGQTQVMRLVPSGSFEKGSANLYGSTVRQLTITQFWLGDTEVTQGMWQAVMGNNPSNFTGDANRPVEQVSWVDCQGFIRKLNNQVQGLRAALPSDSQWEYAYRAGGKMQYPKDAMNQIAWTVENSDRETHPVKTKQANAWGLYDMCGNVWEWCADWEGYDYGSASLRVPASLLDPTGPSSGSKRVIRGGAYCNEATYLMYGVRDGSAPDGRAPYRGFRLAAQATP